MPSSRSHRSCPKWPSRSFLAGYRKKVMITHALELAQSEHVIHFLLSSYVETLDHYGSTRSLFPPDVRHLPLGGKLDIQKRLSVVRTLLEAQRRTDQREIVAEAVQIFTLALRRWSVLEALTAIGSRREHLRDRLQRVVAQSVPRGLKGSTSGERWCDAGAHKTVSP